MITRKALIIEIDESYLKLISGALAGFGFKNLVVKEGREVPQLVKQELPDLIILSVELLGVNGYIVCKEIKETEETKMIPLILTSSGAEPEDFERHRKLRIRADEYLLKPFSKEDLLQKVNTIIDKEEQLRKEGMIPSEQRVVLEDKVMVQGKGLAAFRQIVAKIKHQNKTVVEKLRRELKEKTESEGRLSRMLAAEKEGFQREKTQSETKLRKEIDELREEKNRLKTNISELEAAMQKADQAEEIKNRLDQALAERDELRQQYQTTMEEKSSLSEDLKRELEEKGTLISKNEVLQREIETLQERLIDHEEKVTEARGLIERSKEFEAELIRKTEELEAQLAPSKKKEEELEKEISLLKEEKDRLKMNISELEVASQKADQAEEIKNRLDQALAERGELKQQYQTAIEERISQSEDLKRELEEKGTLISNNKALRGEIEALQERLREREEKVAEAEGLTEKPKELESEVIRKTEELEAQLTPSKEKEEELEKEISMLKEEKERLEKEVPEAEEAIPEAAPMEKLVAEKRAKRSPLQLGIIGGVVALLVFSLAALYFLTDIFSPSRSTFRLTPEATPVVSVPPMSKKTIEKAETEPREGEKEEQEKEAPETTEKKEEKTVVKAETKPQKEKKEEKKKETPETTEKREEKTIVKAETKPQKEKKEEKKKETPETIKKREEKTTKEAPTRKPKTKPTAKVAKKEVLRYTVQVGAYTNKAELVKVVKSLKKLGIEPYTVKQRKKSKKKLYHVYLDRNFISGEANSVSMKLKTFEIKHKKIKQKDGKYSIFAGKFSTLNKAKKVKQKIKDAGYAATITPKSSTQRLYICRAGKFSTKKEAGKTADTLRNKGYKPEIVELKK